MLDAIYILIGIAGFAAFGPLPRAAIGFRRHFGLLDFRDLSAVSAGLFHGRPAASGEVLRGHMTTIGVLQIAVYFGLLLAHHETAGLYMAQRVRRASARFCTPCCARWRALIYKLAGIREDVEQRWTQYAASLLAFSLFGFLFVYLLQRLQGFLPLNPQGFGAKQVRPIWRSTPPSAS